MNKTIALAIVAASLITFPVATPSFAVDTSISDKCGPDGPESYKRAGGFCEQIGSNNSLVDTDNGCRYPLVSAIELKSLEAPVLVAEYCYDDAPAVAVPEVAAS